MILDLFLWAVVFCVFILPMVYALLVEDRYFPTDHEAKEWRERHGSP